MAHFSIKRVGILEWGSFMYSSEYTMYMSRVILNLPWQIYSDLNSCKHRFFYLWNTSPLLLKIFISFFAVCILLFSLTTSSIGQFITYILKMTISGVITFLIFTLSDTFWFLVKKNHMFHTVLSAKRNHAFYVRRLRTQDLGEVDNPIGEIYVRIHFYAYFVKQETIRIAVEVGILLIVLIILYPYLFVFNVILVGAMYFYVFIYDDESIPQVRYDLARIIQCVEKMYIDNQKECKKFIFENKMPYVRKLDSIYNAIKNN